MNYLIIGLGVFGENLARNLVALGNQVVAVDRNEAIVDQFKDQVTTVYAIDTTDESQMGVLPLKSVDLAIVTIGENFGASVRTVAILKHLGVQHIYARAIDSLHRSILECFEIDRILAPEERAATDLAMEMMLGAKVETLSIDGDNAIVKFTAPDIFDNIALTDITAFSKFNIKVIALTRPTQHRNLIGVNVSASQFIDPATPDLKIEKGDVLTCLATRKAYRDLCRYVDDQE